MIQFHHQLLWYKIMMSASIVCFALILHLYLALSRKTINILYYMLIYIPPLMIIPIYYRESNPLSTIFYFNNIFWYYTEKSRRLYTYAIEVFSLVYMIATISICFETYRRTHSHKEKVILAVNIVSIITMYLFIVLLDVILVCIGDVKLPPATPFFILLYVVSTAYVLYRYNFMNYNLDNNFDEILEKIHDIVFIVDREGYIVKSNINVRLDFNRFDNALTNSRYVDFIIPTDRFNDKYSKLLTGKLQNFSYQAILHVPDDKKFITKSRYIRIKDKYGDFIGIMIISKINFGLTSMLERKKISTRQIDIIILTIQGYSNQDISTILKISKRTVESHLLNIFMKLSVYKKSELIKLIALYL
ncbi:MAG: helix-turn-helix transcriptional regulator [Spirochaetes bacterium]|nr:helix-turn-helix transcriptional regulator [Spirochaetota bacterium]